LCFPTRLREIDALADRIAHEDFGEAAVARQIAIARLRAVVVRGLQRCIDVIGVEAEMID
jgi:hypothetical protein